MVKWSCAFLVFFSIKSNMAFLDNWRNEFDWRYSPLFVVYGKIKSVEEITSRRSQKKLSQSIIANLQILTTPLNNSCEKWYHAVLLNSVYCSQQVAVNWWMKRWHWKFLMKLKFSRRRGFLLILVVCDFWHFSGDYNIEKEGSS